MEIHIYIPHDVIEKYILSRLPVKSLLRFKAVCKQWSGSISDPIFGHTHLQQSIKSVYSYRSFFIPADDGKLHRAALERRHLRELPPLQYPVQLEEELSRSCRSRVWHVEERSWCYCDGMFLIWHRRYPLDFVVWNPSRRAHKKLLYPYPEENLKKAIPRIGIYYHSLTKDYKVVIVGDDHNAVFSCKNNSWSEMRSSSASAISFDDDPVFSTESDCVGVSYEESVYWIRYVVVSPESEERQQPRCCKFQVVCFDGRDETLKIIYTSPGPCPHYQILLFSSPDGLYLIRRLYSVTKILPVWMELGGRDPFCSKTAMCFIPQNKVILSAMYDDTSSCAIYDHTGTETTIIIQAAGGFRLDRTCYILFPCIQTLFLP